MEVETMLARQAELQNRYHELVSSDGRPSETRAVSDEMRDLRIAIARAITGDAGPCPDCAAPAMGMLKTPGHVNKGQPVPPVYEIGCSGDCRKRARGWTPELARERWAKGEYVVEQPA